MLKRIAIRGYIELPAGAAYNGIDGLPAEGSIVTLRNARFQIDANDRKLTRRGDGVEKVLTAKSVLLTGAGLSKVTEPEGDPQLFAQSGSHADDEADE
jgi:hypothetical protein